MQQVSPFALSALQGVLSVFNHCDKDLTCKFLAHQKGSSPFTFFLCILYYVKGRGKKYMQFSFALVCLAESKLKTN